MPEVKQAVEPYRVREKLFADCSKCYNSVPVTPQGGEITCKVCGEQFEVAKYINRGGN
jgi:hypothetical protein